MHKIPSWCYIIEISYEWFRNILSVACDVTIEKLRKTKKKVKNERSVSKYHTLKENLGNLLPWITLPANFKSDWV